jgi:hypothetical protein
MFGINGLEKKLWMPESEDGPARDLAANNPMRLVPVLKKIMARMEDSRRRALWRPTAETERQTVKEDARMLVDLISAWNVPLGFLSAALALAANQDQSGQNDVCSFEGITVEELAKDVEELIEDRGAALVLPAVIIEEVEEDWDAVVGAE